MAKTKKSIEARLKQLEVALRALKNSHDNFVDSKDEAYLLDLMGRLRALIGMGGPFMKPLLIELSKELNIPLEFYACPPQAKAPNQNIVVAFSYGKTWAVLPKEERVKCTLQEWLEYPTYFADKSKTLKTRNQVLKDISNSEGGSHYSEETPHIVDTLNRWKTSEDLDGIKQFLIDLSPLIYWLGNRLLKVAEFKKHDSMLPITTEAKNEKLIKISNEIKTLDSFFEQLNSNIPAFEIQLGNTQKSSN